MSNAPSRYAVHKSSELPIASSVRLLKLFPNDGPTCDLASIAAISWLSLITTRSHSFVGRKNPGNSNSDLCVCTAFESIPVSTIIFSKSFIKPSNWAPPVTALRDPWSMRPDCVCLIFWFSRVCQYWATASDTNSDRLLRSGMRIMSDIVICQRVYGQNCVNIPEVNAY